MNTVPFKTVWVREYQNTHYKQAVFPMFADQRFESQLEQGSTVKWSYDGDMSVGRMGSDGAYSIKKRTVTDESLTVDQRPYAGFTIPNTERIQDHRPTQEKWAKKSMNVVFQDIDGVMLGALREAAASSLDASDFGGSAGDPITATDSNAASIYAAARRILRNQNVIYDMTKKFRNVMKLDHGEKYPVAAIPAELEEKLLLQIGFKDTAQGDKTLKQGYLGMIMNFNSVVSTALPFSFRYTLTSQPGNGNTLTLGTGDTTIGTGAAVAVNWVTTIGSTGGNVLSETNAATSVGHLVDFLNDPFEETSSTKYVGFTRADLSAQQQRILDNVSAVDNEDGSCVVYINGQGAIGASQDDSNGTIDRKAVHALFGTSQSIAMIMQKTPNLDISAGQLIATGETSGYAAKHFLTWSLYGYKVFKTQTYQVVDVPIAADTFDAPQNVLY